MGKNECSHIRCRIEELDTCDARMVQTRQRPRSVIVLICTLNVFQNYELVAEQLPRINKELRLNLTLKFKDQ